MKNVSLALITEPFSGRALLVQVSDGAEIATVVFEYSHALIEEVLAIPGAKPLLDWALQVPSEYLRKICTAGFEGMIQDSAYPSREHLAALNPNLSSWPLSLRRNLSITSQCARVFNRL